MHIDIERLRDIAWTHWDPIGIRPSGKIWQELSCADEYDSYIRKSVKRVLSGQTHGEIVGYLVGVTKHRMGLGSGAHAVKAATVTARAIMDYVEEARSAR